MARVLVGTSGYLYRHWRKVLYPEGLGTGGWLQRYANVFAALELNATFYRLTTAGSAERCRRNTPEGLVFAAKGSRYITHMKKLKDPAEALDRFFAPLAPLRPKLEVVLWQLPPRFDVDGLPRLDAFLAALPPGVRYAIEFREPSWYLDETCETCSRRMASPSASTISSRSRPRGRPAASATCASMAPARSKRGGTASARSPRSPVTSCAPVGAGWTPTCSSTTTEEAMRCTTR